MISSVVSRYRALRINTVLFTLFVALFFGVIVNYPFYSALGDVLSKLENVDIGFVVALPIFFVAAFNLIFNIFSWRFIGKPFFILLVLLSAGVFYGTFKYGVIFDREMIVNIIETNPAEAFSYINLSSLTWFTMLGTIPALIILTIKLDYTAKWYKQLIFKVISMTISAAILLGIGTFYYKDARSVLRNNQHLDKLIIPVHFVQNSIRLVKSEYLSKPLVFRKMGQDARLVSGTHDKPTLLFILLGETARAQNYQLNGYDKKTNVFTRDKGVISFQDVTSCGTGTAASVPCMFSVMNREGYNRKRARKSDGLLDVLQYAGISIYWKENDFGCKGVCVRVPNKTISANAHPTLCNGTTCFDEILLEDLDQEISAMQGTNRVIGLHAIGSHGPTYYLRYPDRIKAFTPDCPRSDIENCSTEEITNTYDNTIRYTDYVMSRLIDKMHDLKDQYNTALIYISDHGESLGENGIYLHSTPFAFAPEFQTKVPMIMWFSDGFTTDRKLDLSCLRKHAENGQYSHDNFFHSVLGIMNVSTSLYNTGLDIFKPCRLPSALAMHGQAAPERSPRIVRNKAAANR